MPYNYLKIISIFLAFIFSSWAYSQTFDTTWKTDNPGVSGTNEITIPASGEFNYTWEEVDTPSNSGSGTSSGVTTITFPNPGTYLVTMEPTGTNPFHRIEFDNEGDHDKILSVEAWGDVVWSSMANAFEGSSNLEVFATDAPDLSQVTDMSGMFSGASSFNQPIEHWDVSNVTTTAGMFFNIPNFDQPLNDWDVSNIEDMSAMFKNASSFNQPLDNWNVGNVENMAAMFMSAPSFNQNIENWDISNVTTTEGMFAEAVSYNQPVGAWDMSNVTVTSGMFFGVPDFNHPLEDWDVSNVTFMAGMFDGAVSFNQPLNNWDTSSLQVVATMFANTVAFNQPLDNWDVSNIWLAAQMFQNASGFDQSLETWELNSLEIADAMFLNSGLSCESYSFTLKGWAENSNLPSDISLGAQGLNYSPDVVDARDYLITELGWIIQGDSQGICEILSTNDFNTDDFAMYPNPSEDVVTIAGLEGTETIHVYNSKGQLLQSRQVTTDKTRLQVRALAKGVYFVSITNENNNTIIKKLLVD